MHDVNSISLLLWGILTLSLLKGLFDVHILKGPPGLFSNPEVKLERVYGVVTWETSGEMCMTSTLFPSCCGDSRFFTLLRESIPFLRDTILDFQGGSFFILFVVCYGCVMGMLCVCYGYVMVVLCVHHVHAVGMLWLHHVHARLLL